MNGTCAVIAAAGRGERFASGENKVFATAGGKPLLAHAVLAFERCPLITDIVVVVGGHEISRACDILGRYGVSKLVDVVAGGAERQDSVARGLGLVPERCDLTAVHDGARPLVSQEVIESAIIAANNYGASVAAVPVIDTIKSAGEADFVEATLDRSRLWSIQTPQVFKTDLIRRAYAEAEKAGFYATDDAALVERLGLSVKLVYGSYDNIKVTTPLDLAFVESRLGAAKDGYGMWRVGFGYDIHRFAPGRRLVLGGVEFPGEDGLEGHSDADVILHAVADAMLGAAALGDIGKHFPNTDPKYSGASSLDLLAEVSRIVGEAGWSVANLDVTFVAEKPKIAAFVGEMQAKIAEILGVDTAVIGIKATTAERLGAIGSGEGAECFAVVTLRANILA